MADRNDYGPNPFILNIEEATVENSAFRVAKWTGSQMQMTLMSIEPGDDIGLEVHHDHDQFLRIESGIGFAQIGPDADNFSLEKDVEDDDAIFIPAGSWHNVTNTGDKPLKLYSIYAPSEHAHGTVHETKEEADAAEAEHHG
jgi:mannose-6-phosphate isomerase-like protein (cupin superfamily)